MSRRSFTLATLFVAALVVTSTLFVASCGSGGAGTATTAATGSSTTAAAGTDAPGGTPQSPVSGATTLTLDELATFDGQGGNPAYVAVDGVVYDVSDSAYWTGGKHSTCNLGAMAGKDLSGLIQQAPPRMRSDLQRMPVVGSLAQ